MNRVSCLQRGAQGRHFLVSEQSIQARCSSEHTSRGRGALLRSRELDFVVELSNFKGCYHRMVVADIPFCAVLGVASIPMIHVSLLTADIEIASDGDRLEQDPATLLFEHGRRSDNSIKFFL